MPTLYLIRHAQAGESGPKYPDDSQRPLVNKGFKQAQTLADVFSKLEVQFDFIFSSPYTRAAQTTKPLEVCLRTGKIHYLDNLASSDYDGLLKDISKHLKKSDKTVALVGHEPYLSEVALYLLSKTNPISIPFKKSAFMALSGKLKAGQMSLEIFMPYSVYKHF